MRNSSGSCALWRPSSGERETEAEAKGEEKGEEAWSPRRRPADARSRCCSSSRKTRWRTRPHQRPLPHLMMRAVGFACASECANVSVQVGDVSAKLPTAATGD